jgi:hypothetical protein
MRFRILLCVLVSTALCCTSPRERRAEVLAEVEHLRAHGRIDQAISSVQAALRSSPNNKALLVSLADLQLLTQECRLARETLLRISDAPGYLLLQARMVARCQAPIVGLEAAWVAGLGRDPALLEDLQFLTRHAVLDTRVLSRHGILEERSQGLLTLLVRMKEEGDQRTLLAWLHALRGAPASFHCGVIARGLGTEAEGWQCLTIQSPPTLHTVEH